MRAISGKSGPRLARKVWPRLSLGVPCSSNSAIAEERARQQLITDFPDSNRFHGSAPCALTTPRPHEPGRSLFFNDVGKLLARLVCRHKRPSSGLVEGGGVVEEEQSVKSV